MKTNVTTVNLKGKAKIYRKSELDHFNNFFVVAKDA